MSFFPWLWGARDRRAKVAVVPLPRGAIAPSNLSVLEQRGWRRSGNTYSGPYATPYGTWHGHLEDAGGYFRCYIHKPPIHALAYHPKLPCFSDAGSGGWWRVNLAMSPIDGDPNAIVLHVERFLTEAHRRAGIT